MELSKKKLLLVPIEWGRKKLVPDAEVHIRINGTNGSMNIGAQAAREMCMEGKFYRLFFDTPNNVIAWQVKEGLSKEQMESKTWKLAKQNNSQQITISVGRILEALNKNDDKSHKCIVKKYALKDNMMEEGDYFFIECDWSMGKPKVETV